MKKTLALAGISAIALMGLAAPAQAVTPLPTPSITETSDHKVNICHRTAAEGNPYVPIEVDIHSIGGPAGHDGHNQQGNGPIGDIIPPFNLGGIVYEGKNWTAEGQAILANGCVVPVVTVTPTPTETTTTTPPATTPPATTPPATTPPATTTTTPAPTQTTTAPGVVVTTTPAAPGGRGFNAQTAAGESAAMGNAAIAAGAALLAGAAGLVLYRRQSSRSH